MPATVPTNARAEKAEIVSQTEGLTILTDPAFDPAGTLYDPGTPVETRRLAAPAVDVADLPPIERGSAQP
jgi:hypothetical protein